MVSYPTNLHSPQVAPKDEKKKKILGLFDLIPENT
jgi:hypothetical protein